MEITDLTELFKTIDGLKTPVIVVIMIIFLSYCALRIWQTLCANKRSKERNEADELLRTNVIDFIHILEENLAIKRQWDIALSDIQLTLVDVKNGFSGKINKANSLRIIQSKFEFISMCFCFIIERSLYYNHYRTQEDYVSSKVKTEMGDNLIDARAQLDSLDLSIESKIFFILQPEQGMERFTLCDLVWNRVESLFGQDKSDMAQKVDRVRLVVKNTVSDYVTKILGTMAKLDVQCNTEMQKQAFERNQRLRDLRISSRGTKS